MPCAWGPALVWKLVAARWKGINNRIQTDQRDLKDNCWDQVAAVENVSPGSQDSYSQHPSTPERAWHRLESMVPGAGGICCHYQSCLHCHQGWAHLVWAWASVSSSGNSSHWDQAHPDQYHSQFWWYGDTRPLDHSERSRLWLRFEAEVWMQTVYFALTLQKVMKSHQRTKTSGEQKPKKTVSVEPSPLVRAGKFYPSRTEWKIMQQAPLLEDKPKNRKTQPQCALKTAKLQHQRETMY